MILTRKKMILKSTVFAGMMVFTGSAIAADLPTSTLPMVDEVKYDEQVEFGSGWYLRGDVGVALGQDPDIKTQTSVGDVNYRNVSTDQAGNFGVGFGYSFESGFRMDMTAEYTSPMRYTGKARFSEDKNGNRYNFPFEVESKRHTGVVMANGYYDFNGFGKYRPYVGAGAGVAWTEVRDTTATDPTLSNLTWDNGVFYPRNQYINEETPNGFADPKRGGSQTDTSRTSFAWALMAGVAFQVTPSLDLDVGYKYLNIGDVRSGGTHIIDQRKTIIQNGQEVANPNQGTRYYNPNYTYLKNTGEHQIRIGLRYKFDN